MKWNRENCHILKVCLSAKRTKLCVCTKSVNDVKKRKSLSALKGTIGAELYEMFANYYLHILLKKSKIYKGSSLMTKKKLCIQ